MARSAYQLSWFTKVHIVQFYLIILKSFDFKGLTVQNSKVFEQKGDLLNLKANIDPRAVLSWAKPDWAETS